MMHIKSSIDIQLQGSGIKLLQQLSQIIIMKVSQGELFSSSAIELAQSKFKGYKKSIKDFRRNLLLKTKCNNRSMKSQSSLQFTPREKESAYALESTIWSHQKAKTRQTLQKSIFTLQTGNAESVHDLKNYYSDSLQPDKRMDEYLCVVFRKASMDTDKLMKAFEQKVVLSEQKTKAGPSPPPNFMKRLKMNYNKIRIRKQQLKSNLQNKNLTQMNNPHILINKLKKTQQFLHSRFTKMNRCSKITSQQIKKQQLSSELANSKAKKSRPIKLNRGQNQV